jgi:ABC-type polysaccharide/polyol phosphate transport system ATPase subunit
VKGNWASQAVSAPAIEINGLWKEFRLYPDLVRSRLKQTVFFWKRYYREKAALQDVNLRIDKGEIVGVLGPNGAGKTTLLKIIAGISYPTRGTVRCTGKVTAVLALGLGFHPRLTGMENLMLAGMMLGMTRSQVRERAAWIVDFSELRDYIHQPLNTYSSGMKARLSFAVAACQEPEILIIDEALATGDIRFVQKCIGRIHEITQSGTTALFVSHNIWSIKKLTRRCILLDAGRIVDDGDTNSVADRYHEVMLRNEVFEKRTSDADFARFVGSGEARLTRIRLLDANGAEAHVLEAGAPAVVEMEVACRRIDGISAFVAGSMAGGVPDENGAFRDFECNLQKGPSLVRFEFPSLLVAPGDFYLDLQIYDARDFSGFSSSHQLYFKTHVLEFAVRRLKNPNRSVVYYQPARISMEKKALEPTDAL